jgi:hypothetical protein
MERMNELEQQDRDEQKQIRPEQSQTDPDQARGLQMRRSVFLVYPSNGLHRASENGYDHGSFSDSVISEDLETVR